MGAVFRLEHANLVAYLTSRVGAPPRTSIGTLREFVQLLMHPGEGLISTEPDGPWRWRFPEFGSGAANWGEAVSRTARVAWEKLPAVDRANDLVINIDPFLGELRSLFSSFSAYAMAVGGGDRLREAARDLARRRTFAHLLVLIPEAAERHRNIEVLDPAPAISSMLRSAPSWPGFVFWSHTGVSTFVEVDAAERLLHELHDVFERFAMIGPPFAGPATFAIDEILRRWTARAPTHQARRILQVSDLHFGSKAAATNQQFLEAELRDVVKTVDRVVVTGDLLNTPDGIHAASFKGFRNQLTHLAGGTPPVVIPGNHDQRYLGILGEDYKQVFEIATTGVLVDDKSKMIFVCVNSSAAGSIARGRITKKQLVSLGAELRTQHSARPELKQYLPIVLVHHHPFSFDLPPETTVQKILALIGLRDEAFLEMADAPLLLNWCADWKIRMLLHGHKHKARYVERDVARVGEPPFFVTSIGCGTSLGAEGAPLSYNILEWNEGAGSWAASFWQSDNGGAFREITATVSPPNQRGGVA